MGKARIRVIKPATAAPARAPRKREETDLLQRIRLAIGARPDVLAARINTGVFLAPDGSKRRIRSAPTGYPDLPITQLRRVLEHVIVGGEQSMMRYEKDEWRVYGQSIFIETKRPKTKDGRAGELTTEQEDFRAAAERVGAIYIAPTTVQEVLELLGPVAEWV